jgi:TetR/AcrR family transcriptional regulator, transcriptional repressor for nem operon
VKTAAALFRARGIDAVSVADVMSEAGLTVGGFYKHFASKDALVAEAIDRASSESAVPTGDAEAAVRGYLSLAHRAAPDRGCPVAALCSEAGYQPASTRRAFTRALEQLLSRVALLFPDRSRSERLHAAAAAVGALALARATDDEKLARELLESVADEVLKDIRPRPR